eukprot:TRINITY_DN15155_c0_g1_i1.p1 TRINITY_DN15155_c0_g1~~TRINITY_DN15155_c0_g1_i1.p1  ORF type:complete len:502 (-),score=41.55 TRINITY_DN15155_c0_g1_i1:113-1399(-)
MVASPIDIATSVLGEKTGSAGICILCVFNCLSSLGLASLLVGHLGPKRAIMLGMVFYCTYLGCFALFASYFSSTRTPSTLQSMGWYAASAIGGIASGILWTSQGALFAATATLLSVRTGEARESLTSTLAGKFAFIYLVGELATKLIFSWFQSIGIPRSSVCYIFFAGSLLTIVMMKGILAIKDDVAPNNSKTHRTMLFEAMSMWGDPLIWLVSFTNLTFGFSAAFMNTHVNCRFADKELGSFSVQLLCGVIALVAAAMSVVFARVATLVGKTPVIIIGAIAFLSLPLSLLILVPCLGKPGCRTGWGWGIVALYVGQGVGRAVFESTNRAVFSDMFKGSQTVGAFANCRLQSSLSFATVALLEATLSRGITVEIIVIVFSSLTMVMHPVASNLHRRRQVAERALSTSEGEADFLSRSMADSARLSVCA